MKAEVPLRDAGYAVSLFTATGLLMANSYRRIVWGDRGPYVEFTSNDLVHDAFELNRMEMWRMSSPAAYYVDYRTKDTAAVKIYWQKRTVDYADYRIGLYYISPFDLRMRADGSLIRCAAWR